MARAQQSSGPAGADEPLEETRSDPLDPRNSNGTDNADYKRTGDSQPCLNAADWLSRELPPREYLLGEVITTTTRALFAADTGLGKTMLGIALAIGLATGSDFLHWKVRRPVRVLYLDGEMPRELIKERLAEAVARTGSGLVDPYDVNCLDYLSIEDEWGVLPLNTQEGQAWMNVFITENGPYDFIIFDNIASLTIGDMRDEESWRNIEPWILSLSARRIGQLWFHHTGHDGSKSYGSKVREWKMDTVMLGERIEEHGADVAMRITFKKARTRTPHNRADFEPFDLRLIDNEWTASPVSSTTAKSEPKGTRVALITLREAIGDIGKPIAANNGAPTNGKGVMLETWRTYYQRRTPLDCDEDDEGARGKALEARKKRFQRAREHLQEAGIIQVANEWYWIVKS